MISYQSILMTRTFPEAPSSPALSIQLFSWSTRRNLQVQTMKAEQNFSKVNRLINKQAERHLPDCASPASRYSFS